MEDNEDLVIALAMALGRSQDNQIVERNLAYLITPFAKRLLENANQENAENVLIIVIS